MRGDPADRSIESIRPAELTSLTYAGLAAMPTRRGGRPGIPLIRAGFVGPLDQMRGRHS
jgi:hypothetical protein